MGFRCMCAARENEFPRKGNKRKSKMFSTPDPGSAMLFFSNCRENLREKKSACTRVNERKMGNACVSGRDRTSITKKGCSMTLGRYYDISSGACVYKVVMCFTYVGASK